MTTPKKPTSENLQSNSIYTKYTKDTKDIRVERAKLSPSNINKLYLTVKYSIKMKTYKTKKVVNLSLLLFKNCTFSFINSVSFFQD